MRRAAVVAIVVAAAVGLTGTARATPLAATLTAANGAGTFDATLACPAGDGPSWRYAYSGATAPILGPLGGTWSSSIEVHDAGAGAGFVPVGGGRLSLASDRGGTASLEFGAGGCANATVTIGLDPDGHPTATGALPLSATGGSGALRGFTGAGSASFALGLGPGAANYAAISLAGDFTVRQPHLAAVAPKAFWRNLTDYLVGRLSVSVPIVNDGTPATVGDAFAVRLASATMAHAGGASGVPASLGRIDAGATRTATVTFSGAAPLGRYTLTTRLEGTDALDGPLAPVVQSTTVTAPLLP